MAWTSPMTAVANAAFTAAQFNLYIRDNLAETAPAKATTDGRIFVSTGANQIVERVITGSTVNTGETTTSTSYTALTTPGPACTATTGFRAILISHVQLNNNTAGAGSLAAVAVTGATTVPADDNISITNENAAFNDISSGYTHYYSGLTAGSNTFTIQYRVSAGTGTFLRRHVAVIAL